METKRRKYYYKKGKQGIISAKKTNFMKNSELSTQKTLYIVIVKKYREFSSSNWFWKQDFFIS